jgi:hypothetical protein
MSGTNALAYFSVATVKKVYNNGTRRTRMPKMRKNLGRKLNYLKNTLKLNSLFEPQISMN